MLRRLLAVALVVGAAGNADAQDLHRRASNVFKPIPSLDSLSPVPPEKLLLGKMLFFEPRLSASFLISCNSCHNIGLGGADLQETSTGHKWQKGPRNAPTVLNAVYNMAQFWDGRAKDLAEQAKGPMQAMVEMGNTPTQIVATLKTIPEYVRLFGKAFPQEKDPVTFDNVAKAIEAFEGRLITPNAPFDRYLRGDTGALSGDAQEGLKLFMDKRCFTCHSGMNVGGTGYFTFGVMEKPDAAIRPPDDLGRFKVTNTAEDEYVFRSPSLRNVALTPPYFHSGKVWRLPDAVAVMGAAQLGIKLNDREQQLITAFLHSLTGDQPKMDYPILPPNTEATPRPVLQ